MKIKLTPNIFPLKIDSTKFKKLLREFLLKEIEPAMNPLPPQQGASQQQVAQQKAKDPHNNPKRNGMNQPTFPMDFILFKFPELKKVLTELLTVSFRNYIENIYNMAPKPTTFKIVLKNKQSFLIIYNERSYIAKVEGKKFYLLNLSEKESCIEHIANLLNTKQFITTKSEADNEGHSGPDGEHGAKSSKKGGGGGHPGRPPENKNNEAEDLSDLDKLLGNEVGPEEEKPEGEEKKPEESEEEPLKESIFRVHFLKENNENIHIRMENYHKQFKKSMFKLKQKMRSKGYEI